MTRQEDGSVLYAVYGTLRQGCGNHRYISPERYENTEFLGEMQTDAAFTMYHLGGFPGVAESGSTPITIEVYKTTNPEVIRGVNGLEGYSGVRGNERNWYDTVDVTTPWGQANMFTMNGLNTKAGMTIVESGDWTKR